MSMLSVSNWRIKSGPAGAGSQANRDLLATVCRASEHHTGDIRARNQQHQTAENQEKLAEKRDILLPDRQNLAAAHEQHAASLSVFACLTVGLLQLPRHCIQLRFDGRLGHSGLQPPDHLEHGHIPALQGVAAKFRGQTRVNRYREPCVRRK